jgi:hypothetical protein
MTLQEQDSRLLAKEVSLFGIPQGAAIMERRAVNQEQPSLSITHIQSRFLFVGLNK